MVEHPMVFEGDKRWVPVDTKIYPEDSYCISQNINFSVSLGGHAIKITRYRNREISGYVLIPVKAIGEVVERLKEAEAQWISR